jgi:hypothetical protein
MFPTSSNPLAGAGESPADAPRGRPRWFGLLRLSLVTVPVKAYPAHAADSVNRFNQMHVNCGRRIRMSYDDVAGIVAGACGNTAILVFSNKLVPNDRPDIGYAIIRAAPF